MSDFSAGLRALEFNEVALDALLALLEEDSREARVQAALADLYARHPDLRSHSMELILRISVDETIRQEALIQTLDRSLLSP